MRPISSDAVCVCVSVCGKCPRVRIDRPSFQQDATFAVQRLLVPGMHSAGHVASALPLDPGFWNSRQSLAAGGYGP